MYILFAVLMVLSAIQGVVFYKVKKNNKRWEHLLPGYKGPGLYCVPGDGEYNKSEPKHKISFTILLSALTITAVFLFI